MKKAALFSFAFSIGLSGAFYTVSFAGSAHAQNASPTPFGSVSFLKQRDFAATVDAISALARRPKAPQTNETDGAGTNGNPQLSATAVAANPDEKTKVELSATQKSAPDATTLKADTLSTKANATVEKNTGKSLKTGEKPAPEQTQKQALPLQEGTTSSAGPPLGNTQEAQPIEQAAIAAPAILPRQHIELHFADYAETRAFLKVLGARFNGPDFNCSRASISAYRLPDNFTLRVHMMNLNPDDVSPNSSVDGPNGLRLALIDGKLSPTCDIATLKADEDISSSALTQLAASVLSTGGALDETSAQNLISPFGVSTRQEEGCFVRFETDPEKDLPHLHVSLSVVRANCIPDKGFSGLAISYNLPQTGNPATSAPDPLITVKMFRALENAFHMDPIHNIAYLWKEGPLYGVIRTPIAPAIPVAVQMDVPQGKISLEVGRWYGRDDESIQTLWNSGNQPYGGMTTSEEYIP